MAELREKKLEITIGLFLLAGIIAWLVIPMSFQDTTIILESGTGGAPVSCLPGGGLVLAQNLTDLCDVTIISPTTDQLIKFNGSQWVNVDSAFITTNATCTNLGTGTIICASDIDNVLGFKSLVELNGIDITNSSSEIFIRNTGVLSANAGTGISVNQTTGNVLISNTLPENTECNNIGAGIPPEAYICVEGTNMDLRSIALQSAGLTIDNDTQNVLLELNLGVRNTGDPYGEGVFSTFTGGCQASITRLCIDLKNLLAGTGISLSSNSTHITITNTAPDNTVCANVGTGTIIYKDGECNFKTLVGSPDISVTNTTNTVVIDYNGTHVTSLTSDDTATLSYSASTGAITTTPVLKKLCEFTGVGGETSITCTFSSSQQVFYPQIHYNATVSSGVWELRFNNDTGNNYSYRTSTNGAADATVTNTDSIGVQTVTANFMNVYMFSCHNHSSTMEKQCIGDRVQKGAGSGSAPSRVEIYANWANVSSNVSSINLTRTGGTGSLVAGSHIIVWGYS